MAKKLAASQETSEHLTGKESDIPSGVDEEQNTDERRASFGSKLLK